jgi:hypothetical protein
MWIQYLLVTLIVVAALLFALWRLPGNVTRRRYTAALRRLGGGHGALNGLANALDARIARAEAAAGCSSCSSAGAQGQAAPPASRRR